jgi:hypothetical protein
MNVERAAMVAAGLILAYLLLAPRSSQTIQSLAGGVGGLFGVLQGRNVNFPGGVSVSGGIA